MFGGRLLLTFDRGGDVFNVTLIPSILARVRKRYFIIAAMLLLPALLTNLGLVVFIDDEAIRSLVAQEMRWSGDFLVPTLHGDAYLNKPPLWNWLLALSFWLHGGAGEWAARLPTVVGLLGFTLTTYLFSRRHFGNKLAAVHALTVVTCGRMLFWDSFLALIDVTFSWVIYTQIMLLYYFGKGGRWWRAFAWTYALTAVAFMLKGLPAIVFQGISVFAIVGWQRSWGQLFRPAHLASGVGCLLLLSLYYLPYSARVDLLEVATRLFDESSKRTAVSKGLYETVSHLFSFPFEMAYHFLPWTVLLVYLISRGSWGALKANDFAAFCLVAFLANIPVYWLSPNVYPRYLLMLFPLLFASLLWLHQLHARRGSLTYRYLRYLLLGAMTVAAAGMFALPFITRLSSVSYAWPKALVSGAAAGAMILAAWRKETDLLPVLCCYLLLLRLVFDLFILPVRAIEDERGNALRQSAEAIATVTEGEELSVFRYILMEPATSYYLSVARDGIVPRRFAGFDSTSVYIGSDIQYPELQLEVVDSLYLRHFDRKYPVGRLRLPVPLYTTDGNNLQDGMGSGIMNH